MRPNACVLAFLCAALLLSGCMGVFGQRGAPELNLGHGWNGAGPTPRVQQVLGSPHVSGLDAWPDEFQASPLAADIDGDGRAEIIAYNHDNHVYVFNATSGRVVARLATTLPPGWHVDKALNGVAAARLGLGQPISLIATNPAGYVYVWQYDPAQSDAKRLHFQLQWHRRMNDCFAHPAIDAKPVVTDLNGDGKLEILVQTEEPGLFALRANGTLFKHHCWGGGNAAPLVADLDGDRKNEVIFASDDGVVMVLDGAFHPRWSFNAADPLYGIKPASISATPTVAELDGKLPREIIFTARHAPNNEADQFTSFRMAIFAIRESSQPGTSELVWMRQPTWANPLSNTELVATDVDRDGKTDIFGMDWNTIGHRPGNWERLGPAHIFRLRADGSEVWHREVDAWWSNQEIAVGDSDGDGQPDVLAAVPVGSGDGIWRFSAATGAAQGSLALPGMTILRGPTLLPAASGQPARLMFPAFYTDNDPARGSIILIEIPPRDK